VGPAGVRAARVRQTPAPVVATVALLTPDLLFGSKVEGGLRAAGHTVTRYSREEDARAAAADADVLIVDLTTNAIDGVSLGSVSDARTLGFYSHVEQDTRARAEESGFDLVVPRSRMAREMGALVERLVES
jgi:DNA-binding response OmpR family regulator